MERVEAGQIQAALRRAGLKPGDAVMVHSRLYAVGAVRGVATPEIPSAYLDALQEVVGESGTILVPTFTFGFSRYGRPFILEETPSEMGVLSEALRRMAASCRSLHPIHSHAAIGAQAQAFTGEHPRWNVGHDTTWDRMLRRSATVVSIGIPLRSCLSLIHQVEYLACVPYRYNKVLRGEVRAGGAVVPGAFFMAVNYLGYGITIDLSRFEDDLACAGAIRTAPLGGSAVWAVSADAIFTIGMKGLRRDPYYLLRTEPQFVEGEIPCDGTTIQREKVAPRFFLA